MVRVLFPILFALAAVPATAAVVSVRASAEVSGVTMPADRLPAFNVIWSRMLPLGDDVAHEEWDFILAVRDPDVDPNSVRWVYSRPTGLLRPLSKQLSGTYALSPSDRMLFHRLLGLETAENWTGTMRSVEAVEVIPANGETKALQGRERAGFGIVWEHRLPLKAGHEVSDFRADASLRIDGTRWLYDRRGFVRLLSNTPTPINVILPGAFRRFSRLVGTDVCDLDIAFEALMPSNAPHRVSGLP